MRIAGLLLTLIILAAMERILETEAKARGRRPISFSSRWRT